MENNLYTDPFVWLSPKWFRPETLKGFDWEWPLMLWLAGGGVLLLLLRWLYQTFFRQKLEVAFFRDTPSFDPSALLRLVPPVFLVAAFALAMVALARPQKTNVRVEPHSEGIDIMLLLDISESMKLEDFKPNRLESAKKTALDFINGRFQDRIGLVVFSGEAYSLSPLTTDYGLLRQFIEEINFDMVHKEGTAIGSALSVGTNRMRETSSKSKVMILLSDGENTAGNIDPITAANLAKAYGTTLYTIGVGKEGPVPYGKDLFGNTQYVKNNLDESALREIADIGNGEFFRATNSKALENIFEKIDEYEKTEIKETRYQDTRDFYHIYLAWAVLAFLVWMVLKNTFMVNALED